MLISLIKLSLGTRFCSRFRPTRSIVQASQQRLSAVIGCEPRTIPTPTNSAVIQRLARRTKMAAALPLRLYAAQRCTTIPPACALGEHRVIHLQRSAQRRSERRHHLVAAVIAGLLCACPLSAFAQLAATVSAIAQYQYNSNVFDLQRGILPAPDYYSLAASDYSYGAALNLNDQISRQNVYLRASGTQFEYDHFDLTHTEYTLDGGSLWKAGNDLGGTLDISRSRMMVPFTALITSSAQALQLYTATDQRETVSADYQFVTNWVIDLHAFTD